MHTLRAAALGIVLFVIALLVHGAGSTERQWRELTDAERAGNVATLAPQFLSELSSLARLALDMTGSDESVDVNRLVDRQRLNVVTYRSDVQHRFNFGVGNARYEQELDIIFVDEALLDLGQLLDDPVTLEPHGTPPMGGFVLFALLHELGHRQLHAGIGAAENRPGTVRTASASSPEASADEFALHALQRELDNTPSSYRRLLRDGDDRGIGLECSKMTGHSLTYCAVATVFWTAVQVYLVGGPPFAPFYASDTHPPMTRRAIDLLRNHNLRNRLPADLRAHADTLEEWFVRLEGVGELPARQLLVDRSVQAAAPAGDSWMLITETHFARVPGTAFTRVDAKRAPFAADWRPLTDGGRALVTGYPYVFVCDDDAWCLADLKSGRVQLLDSAANAPAAGPANDFDGFTRTPLPPARWLYVHDDSRLEIFVKRRWTPVDLHELEMAVRKAVGRDDVMVRVANAGVDWLGLFLIHPQTTALTGGCKLPINDGIGAPECVLFESLTWPLAGGLTLISDRGGKFLFFRVSEQRHVTIIDGKGNLQAETRIVTHDEGLKAAAGDRWRAYPAVWLGDAKLATDDAILVMFVGDSVYRIDERGSYSVVMHPNATVETGIAGRITLIPNSHSRAVFEIDVD